MFRLFLILFLSFCFFISVFAETVVLKTGQEIEGTVIEKTDEYIVIDFRGVSLRYYADEITDIKKSTKTMFATSDAPHDLKIVIKDKAKKKKKKNSASKDEQALTPEFEPIIEEPQEISITIKGKLK